MVVAQELYMFRTGSLHFATLQALQGPSTDEPITSASEPTDRSFF